ncbi:hypothetical protein EDD85DRAFT_789727 [Armillaria nabsnona]|nr:hypothetical protein EDD85DRAFT_789727 [Armillaria nabsnona]
MPSIMLLLLQSHCHAGRIYICLPPYCLLHAYEGRVFKYQCKRCSPCPNTSFDKVFAKSFLAFVMSLDPNKTFEWMIAPVWESYLFHRAEMCFNETESGAPAVTPFITPECLLDQCFFWKSVGLK